MQFMKKFISIVFCHVFFRVKYTNLDNLNKLDKCLICPNHSNVFDPTFIYPVTDDIYIMAKSEIFKNKYISKFLKHYNVFPVNRQKVDVKSTITSLSIFNDVQRRKLLIFPEGKVIKKDEDTGKYYRNGAVFIAAQSNVPIVPVFITRRPFIFAKVNVVFGEPIYITKDIIGKKDLIRNESENLIKTIYTLNSN